MYWETHSPLAEGYEGKVQRSGQKRSSFLVIRLTGEELTRVRDIAAKQGLGPCTFARLVLTSAMKEIELLVQCGTLSELFDTLKHLVEETNAIPGCKATMKIEFQLSGEVKP